MGYDTIKRDELTIACQRLQSAIQARKESAVFTKKGKTLYTVNRTLAQKRGIK